jgi:glycosyltransferase involved in cell wall biosynthesis
MIDILLATYNASRFLAETIESIIGQDFTDWRLIIRDGGSKDSTQEISEKYTQMYPEKIISLSAQGDTSACANFSALLAASSAPYIMFCDHDDIWLPNKLSVSLARLKQQEEKDGTNVAMLLFTNMLVVDEKLSIISRSYFAYQHLNPENIDLNHLLVQNVPSGCTLLMNRAIADACGNIPLEAVMHDHWLALVGATMGTIIYLDESTLLYRQHGKNIFGASKYGLGYFFNKLFGGGPPVKKRFYQNVTQAKVFLEQYQEKLHDDNIQVLRVFSSLQSFGWWEKRKILFQYRIFKTGLLRNIGMMLIV